MGSSLSTRTGERRACGVPGSANVPGRVVHSVTATSDARMMITIRLRPGPATHIRIVRTDELVDHRAGPGGLRCSCPGRCAGRRPGDWSGSRGPWPAGSHWDGPSASERPKCGEGHPLGLGDPGLPCLASSDA